MLNKAKKKTKNKQQTNKKKQNKTKEEKKHSEPEMIRYLHFVLKINYIPWGQP